MNGIHLISASAGSGKTHRLVDELERAITRADDPVRPEAIIATTFTVKAAAELRERVRSRLLERGQVEQAQRLAAARMGTVNSVCAQLVTEFAFELGISPECRVLDEAAADEAFERALSDIVSAVPEDGESTLRVSTEDGEGLVGLLERWPGLDWLRDLREIAARARENGISPEQLRELAPRSVDSLLRYFEAEPTNGADLDRALVQALEGFLEGSHDTTKTTAGVVALARQARARLRAGRALSWWEWSRLAGAEPGKATREAYEPVREAARGHERHPALREDVRACITLVFRLAAQALEVYERYKRDWGLMDFVDQEVQALELLRRPHVQEMLREQVDLVLVDEFQDTSPLQLEVFLALSRIAPRSVWVGDQKQAIYGFRGTDPALMDTVLEALATGGESHETLTESWRSRAELVRLTSDVFAPAFAPHGIPPERVRLEPAKPIAERTDTLGAVIEGWRLEVTGSRKAPDAAALAAAVRSLLDDPTAVVRDVVTNEPRRVRPRDIAVLCRSGTNCARVTSALETIGIPAVRPRTGLIDTPEARVTLAALRLWVNPRESLAAAELGRLLAHASDADAWLASVLEAPGRAYAWLPEVERLGAAAARLPLAGPVAAFDAALEAAGVRETCLRWGNNAQRLANLDALRAQAARYVENSEIEGEAATVAGLIAELNSLAEEQDGKRKDEHGILNALDAVTVSTLHGAKGLEWPITVLYEIDSVWKPSAFGVHIESDREGFDFDDPLGGRWIRYWPDPYVPVGRMPNYTGKTAMHDAVRGGGEYARVARRETRETLRLLYVGWTRARDRLAFAARPGKLLGETLGLLADAAGAPLISEPAPAAVWAGRRVEPEIRSKEPIVRGRGTPEPGAAAVAGGPREHSPAHVDASNLAGTGELGGVAEIGAPLFVQEPADWPALGSAIHSFFAADRPELAEEERLPMARALLEAWNTQGAVRPEDLLRASDALRAWVEQRWPGAAWHREWPIRGRWVGGSELSGYTDLALESPEGFVVIDHKCVAGTREAATRAAAAYVAQIGAYSEAIARATGRTVLAGFVHLPVHGLVVSLEREMGTP